MKVKPNRVLKFLDVFIIEQNHDDQRYHKLWSKILVQEGWLWNGSQLFVHHSIPLFVPAFLSSFCIKLDPVTALSCLEVNIFMLIILLQLLINHNYDYAYK